MFGKRSDTDVFKKIKMDKTRSTSEILSFFESRLDSIFDNSKVLKNDDVSLTTEGVIRDSSKLLSMTIKIDVEVEELDARINLKGTVHRAPWLWITVVCAVFLSILMVYSEDFVFFFCWVPLVMMAFLSNKIENIPGQKVEKLLSEAETELS